MDLGLSVNLGGIAARWSQSFLTKSIIIESNQILPIMDVSRVDDDSISLFLIMKGRIAFLVERSLQSIQHKPCASQTLYKAGIKYDS